MKIKTRIVLPMLMLLSAPVIAVENPGQGAEKPPAAQRLNMSGATLTAKTNTAAQPATAIVVDRTDMYIPHPDEVAAQQQKQSQ
jgi:hypothetical protein